MIVFRKTYTTTLTVAEVINVLEKNILPFDHGSVIKNNNKDIILGYVKNDIFEITRFQHSGEIFQPTLHGKIISSNDETEVVICSRIHPVFTMIYAAVGVFFIIQLSFGNFSVWSFFPGVFILLAVTVLLILINFIQKPVMDKLSRYIEKVLYT